MSDRHPDIPHALLTPLSPDPHPHRRRLSLWLISLLLFLPFYYPVLTHFLDPPPGLFPTGFIQPDMPYYVGNAREHFDDGSFHLFYGLPYSPFYSTPRIYFQPQTLLLGVIVHFTGVDPAVAYLIFGVVFGVICCRLALALFEQLFGLRTPAQWLTAAGLLWGGGMLVAVGAAKWVGSGDPNDLFAYDPAGGMWFLNFGRNLLYPTEAYYHAIWLAATICLLRRWYRAVLALVALMGASHPFTGVQLVLVVLAWTALERFWVGNREVPIPFLAALGALLLLHLGYYRWFLGLWIEHRIVEHQWISESQDWTYEAKHFLPAYALTGLLTAWTIRTPRLARAIFSRASSRLLAVGAVVSFALANNEFALRPNIQPLHFTRGYVWMPLYLLGAPALMAGFGWLLNRRIRLTKVAGTAAIVVALVADNAVFLSTFRGRTGSDQLWIQADFRELATFLNQPEQAGTVVLTPPQPRHIYNPFAYLLTVYTPLRTWLSHPYNTPLKFQRHRELRDLFADGIFLPVWSMMNLLIILPAGLAPPDWLTARGGREVYADRTYAVYRIDAAPAAPSGTKQ
jgi:hypothetical protein